MKAVQLLLNSYLPEELRDYNRTYDTKSINSLLGDVARTHPESFSDITKKIADLGRNASYLQGETITLKDLEPVVDKKALFAQMQAEMDALPKDESYKRRWREISQKYNTILEKEVAKNALAARNNVAMAVLSGARGKNAQLKAMIGSPWTFSDYKGEPIDIISKESVAEGMRPVTLGASTYGARASVVSTKSSTAKGGDWAKQMASAAADMVIQKHNCGTHNGLSLTLDDDSLKGRVLAKDTGDYKAGTVITSAMIKDMQKHGVKHVVARSPLTCKLEHGLCAECVGKQFNGGKFLKVGASVGLAASSATAEPVTQMALCLDKDTLVSIPGGLSKKICELKEGDIVMGATKEGDIVPASVVNVFDQGLKRVRMFGFVNDSPTGGPIDSYVTCTEDHKFLWKHRSVEDTEVLPIKNILSKPLKELVEDFGNGWLGVDDHIYHLMFMSSEFESHCFDIEVNHPDHLFVLANGMITSNSAKHTAGMTSSKKTFSGLDVIAQFTQSPDKFKDRAAVAEKAGKVESIDEAPQGGTYITVAGEKHYVPTGHNAEVKVGDKVEAGDQLSDGLVDAEDVIRLKGLGEGRKYYSERLNRILADSGAKSDKRLTEILTRAAIRQVRITDDQGYGDWLPDDLVDYQAVQSRYKLPETAKITKPSESTGKYLQQPALHYTIGTQITPKVAAALEENGYDQIYTDDNEPAFKPEMVRLRASSHTNPDWLASLGTSYLTKQLDEASERGADTNVEHNIDYRPRIAYGAGFGADTDDTGEF